MDHRSLGPPRRPPDQAFAPFGLGLVPCGTDGDRRPPATARLKVPRSGGTDHTTRASAASRLGTTLAARSHALCKVLLQIVYRFRCEQLPTPLATAARAAAPQRHIRREPLVHRGASAWSVRARGHRLPQRAVRRPSARPGAGWISYTTRRLDAPGRFLPSSRVSAPPRPGYGSGAPSLRTDRRSWRATLFWDVSGILRRHAHPVCRHAGPPVARRGRWADARRAPLWYHVLWTAVARWQRRLHPLPPRAAGGKRPPRRVGVARLPRSLGGAAQGRAPRRRAQAGHRAARATCGDQRTFPGGVKITFSSCTQRDGIDPTPY